MGNYSRVYTALKCQETFEQTVSSIQLWRNLPVLEGRTYKTFRLEKVRRQTAHWPGLPFLRGSVPLSPS